MIGLLAFALFTSVSFSQIQRKVKPAAIKDSGAVADVNNDKSGRKEMMEELNLTKEQKIKMKEIRKVGKEQRDNIDSDDKLTADQKQMKLHELRREQLQKVQAILTPEQNERIKAMRQSKTKIGGNADKKEDN